MDFYDVIKTRKSVRAYETTIIEDEKINRIKEAIALAPSACNFQPFKFIFVSNVNLKEKICQNMPFTWAKDASIIAIACGQSKSAWHRLAGNSAVDIDVAIAMEHLVLAATAEGLGTCWLCAYDVEKMSEVLGLVDGYQALAITPIGYAKNTPQASKRKDLNELFQDI